MKDEESTFNCTQAGAAAGAGPSLTAGPQTRPLFLPRPPPPQVFVVLLCQPRALQVDVNGQAYLMSPGDHFFVPQQTTYTLSNHSADAEAEVAFTVIKPGAS